MTTETDFYSQGNSDALAGSISGVEGVRAWHGNDAAAEYAAGFIRGLQDMYRPTVGQAVAEYRENAAAIRTMNRNGGRTAATTNAIAWRTRDLRKLETALTGQRELLGRLVEENSLSERLAADPNRPELVARRRTAQADIRRLVKLIGDQPLGDQDLSV